MTHNNNDHCKGTTIGNASRRARSKKIILRMTTLAKGKKKIAY
jgi:hypothetical protein